MNMLRDFQSSKIDSGDLTFEKQAKALLSIRSGVGGTGE